MMNDTKLYAPGTVIFREGDPGDCMYEMQTGCVGVYCDYGGPNQKEVAKLYGGKTFGEMGLLDHAPRSATVVVLEENTVLTKITEEQFFSFFEQNPAVILDVMQQLCNRLRKTTKDYVEACHTAYDAIEAEKSGEKNQSLTDRLRDLCKFYSDNSFYPYY